MLLEVKIELKMIKKTKKNLYGENQVAYSNYQKNLRLISKFNLFKINIYKGQLVYPKILGLVHSYTINLYSKMIILKNRNKKENNSNRYIKKVS